MTVPQDDRFPTRNEPQRLSPPSLSLKKRLLVLAGSCLGCFMAGEFVLRLWTPNLGVDLFHPPNPQGGVLASPDKQDSPFLYNSRVGYEFKPFALLPVEAFPANSNPVLERMNSDGFRGPEYSIPKPAGRFRILAVGDSVVQAFHVIRSNSWEQVLEEALNRHPSSSGSQTIYEVMNAGIGGYVSWQVLARLETRGLKYQPDLVLVLVGWNDLVYSSLPEWRPGLDLSQIERAYRTRATVPERRGPWADLRMFLYRHFYMARLLRQARNGIWNELRIRRLIQAHQVDSGVPFNAEALRLYWQNLEKIDQVTRESGARLALIVPPALLAPELLDDPDLHRRLLVLYDNFPLSTREFWAWYVKYTDAQRQFASQHPEILLIDAARTFAARGKRERLRLFLDHKHLTVEGNRLLAAVVFDAMKANQALRATTNMERQR